MKQLDQLHPLLREEPEWFQSDGTIGTPVEHLDLATVVKVSQAVSGQIELEKLIDVLMVIAVENAGADRGLLILVDGTELRIEAEASASRDGVEVQLRKTSVEAVKLSE